ncbi:hypothetical protein C8Q77DRAFT_574105 [Trametes polyzona]|nr:hypothetical protein C8Q77DRAFT_574105 [Trametes polyzona]
MNFSTVDWNSTAGRQLVEPLYLPLSSACLLYYDYLLTLPSEVFLLLQSRWNMVTWFYVGIRYGALSITTLSLLHYFYLTTSASCRATLDITLVLSTIHAAVMSAFVATRISAIWSRNWYLAAFLFVLGLANPSSINAWPAVAIESIPAPRPLAACISYLASDSDPKGILLFTYLPIITSAIGIVYELLCLILTVLKTFSLHREQRINRMSTQLTSLLLRDGSVYFAVLTALAVVNIIVASMPPGSLPADIQVNNSIARALTPILLTRLIATLRVIGNGPSSGGIGADTAVDLSTVRFRYCRTDNSHLQPSSVA